MPRYFYNFVDKKWIGVTCWKDSSFLQCYTGGTLLFRMPKGKYFTLASGLNGMVLDLQEGNPSAGTKVVMWEAKEDGENENQMWFEDHETGTIRPKIDPEMVLEVQDGELMINYFEPGNVEQLWQLSGDRVENRNDPSRVLDVAGNDTDPGARVCAYESHGGENQQWSPRYLAPRYFMIRSQMNGLVLDIEGGDATEGAQVIMWSAHGDDNQQWWEDKRGVIRSKLNKMALDGSSGRLKLTKHDKSCTDHMWIVGHDAIRNRADQSQVFDIAGCNADEGAELCCYECHGGENQKFTVEYL